MCGKGYEYYVLFVCRVVNRIYIYICARRITVIKKEKVLMHGGEDGARRAMIKSRGSGEEEKKE